MSINDLTGTVIGLAIEVHKILGPGLLENAYKQCLAYELKHHNILFSMEKEMPINYKDYVIDCGYRADFIIENQLIVELKSVEKILPIYEAQILTYMKLANIKTGLLINFNKKLLADGINRFVL